MKKSKLLTLCVIVLLISLLLTSCSYKETTKVIDTVFNEDYEISYKEYKSTGRIAELDACSPIAKTESKVFTLIGKTASSSDLVYNVATQSVVLTLSDDVISYTLSHKYANEYNVIIVNAYDRPKLGSINEPFLYIAYDLVGNELARSEFKFEAPYKFGNLVIFNNTLYSPDDTTGSLERVTNHNSYSLPKTSMSTQDIYHDEYYYHFRSTYELAIYDKDLVNVYNCSFPRYLKWRPTCFALNDGKLLVRGIYEVEDDSKDYDFYEVEEETTTNNSFCGVEDSPKTRTVKYKLFYMLIDPVNRKIKELKFDYYIKSVISACSYKQNDEDFQNFSDSFENVAIIAPINDKRIDYSDAAADIVFMNNNAKISESLMFIDGQKAELPRRIAKDRYLVPMLDGRYTLTDKNGNEIAHINNYLSCYGSYIVAANAIYDLDMNLVYDTRDLPSGTNANIIDGLNDTIYVSETTDNQTVYFSYRNGTKQEICRIDNKKVDNEFKLTPFGYLITKTENGVKRYVMYNNLGEELLNLDSEPTLFKSCDGIYIYTAKEVINGELQNTYYCIYK